MTKNRMLGALSRLEDFLMNLLIEGHSGTALETSLHMERKKTTPRVIIILKQASSEPDNTKLSPRKRLRHGNRSSRGSHILLSQYIK